MRSKADMSQLNLSHRARKTRNKWLSQLTVLLLMKRQESLLYDGHFTGEFGIAKCPNPEGDLYKNLFVIGYCELVAVSKGMWSVKLCTNKILQFSTGGAE